MNKLEVFDQTYLRIKQIKKLMKLCKDDDFKEHKDEVFDEIYLRIKQIEKRMELYADEDYEEHNIKSLVYFWLF